VLPLNDHFDGLLKNLNPPEDRETLAEDLPPIVRDHLRKSDLLDTVEEPPVSRLAGSYGRRTVSGDIHDVDIVIFVAESYRNKPVEDVLDDLAAALKDLEVEGYEKGDVKTNRKQRRSCHVEFRHPGSDDPAFHIDVVPVIRPGDDPNAILHIPDREWTRWVLTQPLGYGKRLSDLNGDWKGEIVPMIRYFKRIKFHNMPKGRPKSYWQEVMVYHAFADGLLQKTMPLGGSYSRAERMLQVLRVIVAKYGQNTAEGIDPPEVLDPCLGHNIAFAWPKEDYVRWVKVLTDAIATLAAIENSTDQEASIKAWKKVFGDDVFAPDEEAVAAEAAKAKAIADAAKITGGIIVPAGSAAKGIPVPEHRAFGDR
jgi:hypothetical protein